MPQDLSASELLTHSTVRIECELQNKDTSTGTGFFYHVKNGDSLIPVIITNKHVVEGSIHGKLHLNIANSTGEILIGQHKSFTFDDFQQYWIFHPDDDVDLCVMPIAPLINQVNTQQQQACYTSLDNRLIPSEQEVSELTAMEEIVMIGYPNGIWDSVNNAPILRRGVTATHPKLDYNGKSEFMIDAACFPGSSGSPVFLFNIGAYQVKSGIPNIGTRIKLLGVLYAGPQHTATGNLEIVNVPTQQRVVAFSRIPNNLGCVIKAKKILDFEPILKTRAHSQSTA
jgi:V8-like Glu-specific endopeptidase